MPFDAIKADFERQLGRTSIVRDNFLDFGQTGCPRCDEFLQSGVRPNLALGPDRRRRQR